MWACLRVCVCVGFSIHFGWGWRCHLWHYYCSIFHNHSFTSVIHLWFYDGTQNRLYKYIHICNDIRSGKVLEWPLSCCNSTNVPTFQINHRNQIEHFCRVDGKFNYFFMIGWTLAFAAMHTMYLCKVIMMSGIMYIVECWILVRRFYQTYIIVSFVDGDWY